MSTDTKIFWVTGILGYLLIVPATAFFAKRGLFVGRNLSRICFPGGQDGGEVYFAERRILSSVGLHAREAPIDLWIVGASLLISTAYTWFYSKHLLLKYLSADPDSETLQKIMFYYVIFIFGCTGIFLVIAAFRRRVTGRF